MDITPNPDQALRIRLRLAVLLLVLLLSAGLHLQTSRLRTAKAELTANLSRPQPRPDTVIIHKVYRDTVRIVQRRLPRTVYVYTQPDTLRRHRIERDTLIAGIRLNSNRLEVERITPRGISLVETYPLPDGLPVEVDIASNGQLQLAPDESAIRQARRRRRWQRLKLIGAFGVGVVIGATIIEKY